MGATNDCGSIILLRIDVSADVFLSGYNTQTLQDIRVIDVIKIINVE